MGTLSKRFPHTFREQCGECSRFNHKGDDPDEDGITIYEKSERLVAWVQELREWLFELHRDAPGNREDVAVALMVLSRRKKGRQWQTRTGHKDVEPFLAGANLQGAELSNITEGLFGNGTKGADVHLEAAGLDGFRLGETSLIDPRIQPGLSGYRVLPKSLPGVEVLGLSLKDAEHFPILDVANLSFAHMDDARCERSSFRGAILISANFRKAKLNSSKFAVANASNAKFVGADLSEVEFISALLEGTRFVGANLRNAQFQNAVLHEAQLDGALLVGADFTGARCLNPESISRAFGTLDTVLPEGMTPPGNWSDEASAISGWRQFRAAKGMD